jgi:hypothetical protein
LETGSVLDILKSAVRRKRKKQFGVNGELGGGSLKNFKNVNITVSLTFWYFYLKKFTFWEFERLLLKIHKYRRFVGYFIRRERQFLMEWDF